MFEKKKEINFKEFLQIFALKTNNKYNEIDIKNSFRYLSQEYSKPGWIKVDKVRELMSEMGFKDEDI